MGFKRKKGIKDCGKFLVRVNERVELLSTKIGKAQWKRFVSKELEFSLGHVQLELSY